MMKRIIILGLVLLLISLPAAAGDTASKKDEDDEAVHIRAGRLNYVENRIEISQGTTIIKGDNTVTAPQGVYYRQEKKIFLEEGVTLEHSDGTIKGLEMTALLEEDEYIFSGEVNLQQVLDDDREMELEAPYLELYLDDNSFKANKGVVIYYDDRVLKGEVVTYNDQDQTLELTENVYIQEENGDLIKSKEALFYLETGEFTADGEVEVEVQL